MEWSADLEIGIEQIDEQHRRFFDFVMDLRESDDTKLDEKFEFLKNYALEHFDAEEAFMEAHEYPRLNEHAQLHVDFIRKYSDMAREFLEFGSPGPDLDSIREMAETWLVNHISGADADYAKFTREKRSENQ
jgi:hemerythrin